MRPEVRASAESAALEVVVGGTRLWLDCAGIAWQPDERLLVVSDLHLEKGASFARHRRFLPPYDTRHTLNRLAQLVRTYDPLTVVSLGDSFHRDDSADGLLRADRDHLAAIASGRRWIWIAGNHDPTPPTGLPGYCADEVHAAGLIFRHEPAAGCVTGEIAGHLHPGAKIIARGRSVRRPCFVTDGHRLVMPSFGTFTGCLNVLDDAFEGLFARDSMSACMLGDGRVHPVPARRLWPD